MKTWNKGDVIYWHGVFGSVEVGKITSIRPDPKGGGYFNCRTKGGGLDHVSFDRVIEDPQAEFEQRRFRQAYSEKSEVEAWERARDASRRQLEEADRKLQIHTLNLERINSKTFHDIMPKWEEPK